VTSTGSSEATAPIRWAPGGGLRALPATFVLLLVVAGGLLLLAVLLEPVLLEPVLLQTMLLQTVLLESVLVETRVLVAVLVLFVGHADLLSAAEGRI